MPEKIPCTTCGAMIVPDTARKNGGRCMPCLRGTRERIEQAKADRLKERACDPQRELWTQLVDRVHASEQGFASLSRDEKTYYAVSVLEGEVYNGGMHQFFSNSSGALYAEALRGLEVLGATETLALLLRAKTVLFGALEPAEDRQVRWETMKQYAEDDDAELPDWSLALEAIDKAYYLAPDNLQHRLEAFADSRGLITPFLRTDTPGDR